MEAVSRNGLMKLRANGIRDFVWHVSQPPDGPEWVNLGSTAGLNEGRLIPAVLKYG